MNIMFCYQCEQTAGGKGCTAYGVCGKSPEVAALQDLLIYAVKGLSALAVVARKNGVSSENVDRFTCEAMFSTLTNVNFDPDRIIRLINDAIEHRENLRKRLMETGKDVSNLNPAGYFTPAPGKEELVKQADQHGILSDPDSDPDVHALKWLLVYGIKGVSAYADHAQVLGKESDEVYAFIHEGLAATLEDKTVDEMLGLVLKCGEINLRAMELLDQGNTEAYGHPTPTTVPLGHNKGKAILVSGHDLMDLEEILRQSKDKGIHVYTHGEMLPTHGYPGLKKYGHFYGHYGTAWQNQHREFPKFPGAILMTTNCLQKPLESYEDNIFTSGLVGWPGVRHIPDRDFSAVIEKALEMPGFEDDEPGKSVTVGFARNTVMGAAEKVVQLVKDKKIRHFFLVGGCDGVKPGRDYYTEFVESLPHDTVVLTLACGKFRFFDRELGEIDGLPRLMDVGQCNDAYSAVQIALALADAFDVGVNDLPLSLVLSWYEQKAVAILLSLLHLGIKDIRLGPSLPAFITPNILGVLVEKFNIMPITNPSEDIAAILT
jgi:hydroxylamine reductase